MSGEEGDMEQSLAALTKISLREDMEHEAPRRPRAMAPPQQPMDALYQSATSARETLEQVQMFADFMLGIGTHPGEAETKPPMGIMPTVAFHADTIAHCMVEIRKLIEQMRAAA